MSKEPDGWIKRGFMGCFDLRSIAYVDELMGNPDYKEYEPVCLVDPERLEELERIKEEYFKLVGPQILKGI